MSRMDEKMVRLAGQFRQGAEDAMKAYQYTVVLRRPQLMLNLLRSDASYYIAHVRAADSCQAIHGARAEAYKTDINSIERPRPTSGLIGADEYEVVAVFFGFCDIAVHSFQVHETLRDMGQRKTG
jgi:hypothetical protein